MPSSSLGDLESFPSQSPQMEQDWGSVLSCDDLHSGRLGHDLAGMAPNYSRVSKHKAPSPESGDGKSTAVGQVLSPAVSYPLRASTGPATCNASFATRDRLRSHLACHEDKVPCQVCGKYLRAAYMADHLKKHSEGPSNFCSICNRGNMPTVSSLPVDGPELVWEA
ncbi:hypothetical protein P7K49_002794 [Saguinus oedipus]|uniref:C2H2-type domain-containing protein n=1 Tax=Saguinus oedipus TaxID=9490 RepID=A0ABQ9WIB9_SAGOE|nr:hypothetical protein P7K49_002794 [Saguinus oedipus]